MPSSTTNSAFWRGARAGAPFLLVIGPFAALFGVVATEAGLNVVQTLMFSVIVIAGAAQFTAIQLMSENAPTVIILATALAVNLRVALYSASLAPHLGTAPLWQRAFAAYFLVDQNYAVSMIEFEGNPAMTIAEKMAFFIGAIAPVAPLWYAFTLVGALVGKQIPAQYGLDFALPITFIAILAPMFRTFAHVAAALTSVVLALVLAPLPYNSGLLVAAVAAMIVGAQVEIRMERRLA